MSRHADRQLQPPLLAGNLLRRLHPSMMVGHGPRRALTCGCRLLLAVVIGLLGLSGYPLPCPPVLRRRWRNDTRHDRQRRPSLLSSTAPGLWVDVRRGDISRIIAARNEEATDPTGNQRSALLWLVSQP